MMERLGSLRRRGAAVALALAVAALVYAALIVPLQQAHRRYDARLAELGERLATHRAAAGSLEDLRKRMQERKRGEAGKRLFLGERSAALAAAEMQGVVKRAVEQARGELVSMQALPVERSDALSEIGVKVRARGDVRALQGMLHALEGGAPVLVVNNLLVESTGALAAASGRPPAKDLVISFDVSGFMAGAAQEAKK